MKLPIIRIKLIIVSVIAITSIVILIILYGLTYEQINSSISTSNKLMLSGDIELELERIASQLKYAESAQRGFLLTNDSSFLKHFQKSNQKIASSFSTLKELLKNDQIQLYNLNELEKLINERYSLLFSNLSLSDSNVYVPDRVKDKMRFGNNLSEMSLGVMNKMMTYQDQNLKVLRKKHLDSIISTPIIYFSIVLITVTIFIFLLLKLNADRKHLLRINDELTITNHSFAQAEKLGGLGYWKYNFQSGLTAYSDNFYSLLGLNAGEQQLNFRSFIKMVHHTDRKEVLKAFKDSFRHFQPFILSYRLNSKDGKLKYIKSIGRIITDNKNQKYLLGISMDITELVMSSKLLEVKNKKLEAFNSDLASFNYVASHDLQAPLRKIQMFISRINDMEVSNLSDLGKEYFRRIHTSAAHMQILINDLLMFSRTNASNKKFELSNLNELLNNAIDELVLQIEEKDARITCDKLPNVYGIPYQLQQLFVNLISNALKFSRDGVDPVINVTCSIVKRDVSFDEEYLSNEYYKITFSDNGIGFEKQYAQKIFNLLFRLHDKLLYPGSGIGLAICKKIIENHFGYIEAEGEPQQGAKFSIYLPVNLA